MPNLTATYDLTTKGTVVRTPATLLFPYLIPSYIIPYPNYLIVHRTLTYAVHESYTGLPRKRRDIMTDSLNLFRGQGHSLRLGGGGIDMLLAPN